VLGDTDVGKTCMLRSLSGEADPTRPVEPRKPSMPTVGIDMVYHDVKVGEQSSRLQIWDTAGQEKFRTFVVGFLRNTHGVIMAYDITRRSSFNAIKSWLEALIAQEPEAVVVLCGNKADVPDALRVVSFAEGAALARILGVPFIETSAKTGLNVAKAFQLLAEGVVAKFGGAGTTLDPHASAVSHVRAGLARASGQPPPDEVAAGPVSCFKERVHGLDLVDTGVPIKLIREEEVRVNALEPANKGSSSCTC
jgi:small GTP-binding protein